MNRKQMIYIGTITLFALVGVFAWNMMARTAYESAEYKVVESDGKFEVREYPDLMLVATTTKMDAQGRDGSFMKLFRYISGANESDKKISMTTPVWNLAMARGPAWLRRSGLIQRLRTSFVQHVDLRFASLNLKY